MIFGVIPTWLNNKMHTVNSKVDLRIDRREFVLSRNY